MFFVTIFCILFALVISDFLWKKHVIKKCQLPTSPMLPIFGNALDMLKNENNNFIEFLHEKLDNKKKTYGIWNLNKLVVYSANVRDMEKILTSQTLIQKNFSYDIMEAWFGNGVLISIGKKWHQRRKIITPTFHFKILEQFVEIFDQQSTILMNKLMASADGKTIIDIYPLVCLAALDIISESAMGVSVKAQENPNIGYVKAVRETAEIVMHRVRKPGMTIDFLYKLFYPKKFHQFNDNLECMKSFTAKVIRERREILTRKLKAEQDIEQAGATKKEIDEDEDYGTKKRAAFLDVLLQASADGKPLNDEDIREEVETFMFAGHDTTTSGISFALYLIARHPEVQQRLFDEIRDVIGDDKLRSVSLRDLNQLSYLDVVIKECLRMYPPAFSFGRLINEDTKLDNVTLPAGTQLAICCYMMLHDPDNFPDPFTFNPERFSPDSNVKIDPFAYIPFSAGPRNCIGQKFGILEMKMAISKMLRYYELLPLGEEPKLSPSITLKSTNGINIGIIERKYI